MRIVNRKIKPFQREATCLSEINKNSCSGGTGSGGSPDGGQRQGVSVRKDGAVTSTEGRHCCWCWSRNTAMLILNTVFNFQSGCHNVCFPVILANSPLGPKAAWAQCKGHFILF